MWTNANDYDRLAMQGEDTSIEDPERHEITRLDDATKKERGEPIYYTLECSCGWRSERGRLGDVLDQSRAHREAL